MTDLNAILAISYRDLLKLLRDPARIVSTFIFPLLFIGILGGTFQANLGKSAGFNYMAFIFTGVFAQTLFQSAAQGVVSLIEDRENDFSQEIFVSPISRYTIVLGKILGESLVALPQGMAALIFVVLVGYRPSLEQIVALIGVAAAVCLFGGVFGLVVLGFVSSRRAAQQIFGFLILPQYFLAGVFNPVQGLPSWLDAIARLAPMRYAVDLARNVFYAGHPEASDTVLNPLVVDLVVIAAFIAVFLPIGTFLFVRAERNR
jgi:ABC-2 type transport system permease protein